MSVEQVIQPVVYREHPASWTAKSLMDQTEKWIYQLTDEDIAELDAAFRQIQAKGLIVPRFGKDDFDIPNLAAKLEPYIQGLNFSLGIFYIKNFPIEKYTKDQASAIFWGIGAHIGKPWPQNARGHLLGDIRDEGRTLDDPAARGYQTTMELEMHTDGADIVGLLCLKQAPEGGENQLCSAVAAYNKLALDNPEVAQHLLDTKWCIDLRGEEAEGALPYHKAPIFTPVEGAVSCKCVVGYIFSAQRFDEVPRLTDDDKDAFKVFDQTIWDEELVVRVRQEAGDILFLNNHYLLHARSAFKDAEDPSEKRHLRRLWLETEEWDSQRPRTDSVFDQPTHNWENSETTVQMWDNE